MTRSASERVVCLHGLGRTPADWDAVRGELGAVVTPALPRDGDAALAIALDVLEPGDAVIGHSMGAIVALRAAARVPVRSVVLTASFYPPARNGRSTLASLADYGAHRVALAGDLLRNPREPAPGGGQRAALASLARLAVRRDGFARLAGAVTAPVLAVHARDDHHVPIDFARAATTAAGWRLRELPAGGHHAHADAPVAWLTAVRAFVTGG